MQPDLPWNVSGISAQAREAARTAARREGLSIGEWLTRRITAAETTEPPAGEWLNEIRQSAEHSAETVRQVAEAMQQLTARVDALAAAAPPQEARPDADIRALSQNLTSALARIETQTAKLTERLTRLEAQTKSAPPRSVPLEDLRASLAALSAHVSKTAAQSDGRVTTLSDSFVSLSGSMDRLRRDFREAMTELDGHLSAFADRLQDVETAFADGSAEPAKETDERREPTPAKDAPADAPSPSSAPDKTPARPEPAAASPRHEPAPPPLEPETDAAGAGPETAAQAAPEAPAEKETALRAQLPSFVFDARAEEDEDLLDMLEEDEPRHRGRIVLLWVVVALLAAGAGLGWYAADRKLSIADIRNMFVPAASQTAASAATEPAQASEAFLRIEKLARGGNAKAMLVLGLKYADGDGVAADDAQARVWLARAGEAGEAVAQYRLGVLYERMDGGAGKAVEQFTAAAQKGNVQAMYLLGSAYATGTGVTRDYAEAARWFRQAADLGLADAAYNLAGLYEAGHGVAASQISAYKWYAVAAAEDDSRAAPRMETVAGKLSAGDLAAAKAAATAFRAIPSDPAANRVPAAADLTTP